MSSLQFSPDELLDLGFTATVNPNLSTLYQRGSLAILCQSGWYDISNPLPIYSGPISNRLLLVLIFKEHNIPMQVVGEAVSDTNIFTNGIYSINRKAT